LAPFIIPLGVVILQCDDDTIILFRDDVEIAIHVKILLYLYERMVGIKINFDKSEILMTLEDTIKFEMYVDFLNCHMVFLSLNT
jgi:hypothetical protein